MLLKNWYRCLARTFVNVKDDNLNVTNVAGTSVSAGSALEYSPNVSHGLTFGYSYNYAPYMGRLSRIYATSVGGVLLGDGNTEPSLDDYRLSGNIISTVSAATVTPTVTISDGSVIISATYSITNTGTEDITISEIGLMGKTTTSSSYETTSYLVERTVLDSPVTIPAGGVGQVTYAIRMNYPT